MAASASDQQLLPHHQQVMSPSGMGTLASSSSTPMVVSLSGQLTPPFPQGQGGEEVPSQEEQMVAISCQKWVRSPFTGTPVQHLD